VSEPGPRFDAGGPVEVVDARTLFAAPGVWQHQFASLARLDAGRLLLTFRRGAGPVRRNDGALVLASSDDDGATWTHPRPVYAYPGWDCINLGGLARFSDQQLVWYLGRLQMDDRLPGEEPCVGWYCTSTVSRDGGETWTEPGPEIRLFPGWTELYGASNPHRLADGGFMLAVIGTQGRDLQWRAGVAFTDDLGQTFSEPVIIAQVPDRDFSDMDIVRLSDGRFLAVGREHFVKHSVYAHSGDEGRTWTALRLTGFMGANIKLLRLRSGAVLCAYRDEAPERAGVSCSVSEDGGHSWRFVGQLNAADPSVRRKPGNQCGYPDFAYVSATDFVGVAHPYADLEGRVDLHFFRLRDRT